MDMLPADLYLLLFISFLNLKLQIVINILKIIEISNKNCHKNTRQALLAIYKFVSMLC